MADTQAAGRPPIIEVLANLKVSTAQLRLYPKDSPQVMGIATAAYQSVTSFLNQFGTLVLSRTPRGLLVNGKRIGATGELADHLEMTTMRLLEEVRIKSISIKKGLTIDELITFLHALTRKFWDVKDGKEINKRLREERVLRVTVDEVEYVAVGEGDLVVTDAARKLAGTGTRVGELMRTLDQLIEAAVEEGTASDVRLQIMKKLLEQDPTLIARAQQEGLPGSGTDAPGWITFEQARQSLGEIIQLRAAADPETKAALARIGQILVGGFKHDATLCALIQKFLSEEAADLMPSWMKGAVEKRSTASPAVARANSILSMEEDAQLDALAKEGGPLVKELIALDRRDIAEEIIQVLLGFVRDRSTVRRANATDALVAMRAHIEADLEEGVRTSVENRIRVGLLGEGDPKIYGKLADMAADFVDARNRKLEFGRSVEILEVLRKQYQVKDAVFPSRVELAYHALERVASGSGFPTLMEKMLADDTGALRVVESLDAAATRFLIERIKSTENAVARQRLGEVLARVGPSAAAVLTEEVQKTSTPVEALRLLDVLPYAVPDNMAEVALRGLLRHSVLALRRRAASILAERSYARAGTFLIDALKEEKDPTTRVSIIDALGRLRSEAALEPLAQAADARSEADEVRVSACFALAKIANPAVIATLGKLATARGLSNLLGSVSPAVRAAACRALGVFASDPRAADALKKAQEDSDGAVRSSATEALHAPLIRAFGDLVREVQLVSAVQEVKTENFKLAGSLKEIPLDQICQLVSGSAKSGLLLLNIGGATGKIYFENGQVVFADYGGREGQEAVSLIFPHRDGVFLFQPGEAAPKRTMRTPVQQLLLEASRRADEASKT